ncbi:YciI family protein [Cucumibacter marinus]|uniref:YciI family protein n=1 Tax=Cucumibacter marinus TaxID=1121252 RepID=UPI000407C31C|nr:YciI family protein [Cucumibacter marinus]
MSGTNRNWRQRIDEARAEGLAAREYFVVFSDPAGDKQAVSDHLAEHLTFQRRLEAEGKLVAAGPLSDETGTDWTGRGMIVLRAENLEAARAIAEADPMHRAGARHYTILPWLMNEMSFTLTVSLAEGKVAFL